MEILYIRINVVGVSVRVTVAKQKQYYIVGLFYKSNVF